MKALIWKETRLPPVSENLEGSKNSFHTLCSGWGLQRNNYHCLKLYEGWLASPQQASILTTHWKQIGFNGELLEWPDGYRCNGFQVRGYLSWSNLFYCRLARQSPTWHNSPLSSLFMKTPQNDQHLLRILKEKKKQKKQWTCSHQGKAPLLNVNN